ncbi:MAG: MarR family transcriptional regulator [Akkermansiaceae bacterium]|nr:MarR family transcriptional regulator [Akkermansiaceae bacterium]
MPNTQEVTVPLIDKMRAIIDHINRAGVVAMTDSVRKKLARLSVRQCAVLANIRRYTMVHPEGVPMSQLAERVGMSPSAASHMIDSLMGQGLVERHQSPTDRRAVLVTIAKSFMAPTAAIDKAQTAAIEELRSHLTEEELRIHERVIEKLYAAVLEREGI